MATIRDVARLSGVSIGTVSNVLNARGGEVSEETRRRVLEAVRRLRYRPTAANPGRPALRTRNVGVVMRNFSESPILANPFFGAVLDGIIGAAGLRHWSTTVFVEAMWEDVHKSLRTYCDGRSDGLLVVSPPEESPIVSALKERGIPFVVIAGAHHDPDASTVNIDNRMAVQEAVEHLASLGHRRIAHLAGTEGESDARERVEGFRTAMAKLGLPLGPGSILNAAFNAEIAYQTAPRLFEAPEPPTAVFCANDQIALGLSLWLSEHGWRVPKDVSLVGFDDLPFAATMNPPLTTVRQPLAQLGHAATDLLLELIEGNRTPGTKITLPTQLVVRGTTAPPRKGRTKPKLA
ncbi:MAG: LacI family transcriptional regulator [Fimbriimonadales bacterium]|nr:LacI family transcriptional regulator [Fimbriimonadales bacterium]